MAYLHPKLYYRFHTVYIRESYEELYDIGVEDKEILSLADELMRAWGIDGWKVRFDRALTRGGTCRHYEHVITLSRPLLRLCSLEQVCEIILHEIAHAIVGPSHNHDVVWKKMAQKVGATPRATITGLPRIERGWKGTCPMGHNITRLRKPSRETSCARCSPKFNPNFLITWERLPR